MVEKNPAAVELGKLGGNARARALSAKRLSEIAHKGVAARMQKLSKRKRQEIARKAALTRWKKQKDSLQQDDKVV